VKKNHKNEIRQTKKRQATEKSEDKSVQATESRRLVDTFLFNQKWGIL